MLWNLPKKRHGDAHFKIILRFSAEESTRKRVKYSCKKCHFDCIILISGLFMFNFFEKIYRCI